MKAAPTLLIALVGAIALVAVVAFEPPPCPSETQSSIHPRALVTREAGHAAAVPPSNK